MTEQQYGSGGRAVLTIAKKSTRDNPVQGKQKAPGYQNKHIEEKGEVHMDVYHRTHKFTEGMAKVPLVCGVVVQPKWHRRKEKAVNRHQIYD
ncbi:UNVERIFIED_CONTAM: hypothetical protein K2H54_049761 [Gekko kuhli]